MILRLPCPGETWTNYADKPFLIKEVGLTEMKIYSHNRDYTYEHSIRDFLSYALQKFKPE